MPVDSSFKTCQPCRLKDKAKREKTREKIRLIKLEEMRQHTGMTDQAGMDLNFRKYVPTSASTSDRRQENASTSTTHFDGSRKVSAGVKRKAQKSLYELEGEERRAALKMAKKSLTEIIQRQGKKPIMPAVNVKSVSGHRFLFDKRSPFIKCCT
jgi:hypothetical protein